MGCWGMGITQSDEYCEIYERFIEEYDEGKPLSDIKKDILDEYLEEFDENDGILHDVYFAIGKAEWMCGGISAEILSKITQIIDSGKNIDFYKELEASKSDLKLRQKNLDKFLSSLAVPREKARKRKIPTERYQPIEKPKLPPFKCGDIFLYEVNGKYRLLCLISRGKFYSTVATYCYVWQRLYEAIPSIDDLVNELVIPLGYFTAETFPNMENLKYFGNIPDLAKLNITIPGVFCSQWAPATWAVAKEENLSEEFPAELCMRLSDCFKKIHKLKGCND